MLRYSQAAFPDSRNSVQLSSPFQEESRARETKYASPSAGSSGLKHQIFNI